TLNVASVHGGFKMNVVPDFCIGAFDIRLVPGQSGDELLATIEARLKEIEAASDGLTITVKVDKQVEPFVTDPESDLVRSISRACEQVTDETPKIIGKTGYSDANSFAHRLGIPSVAFGPGTIGPGHTPDEWLEIADLKRVAKAY